MEQDIVKVGGRGRITIPKHIRDKDEIRYGSFYRFHEIAGLLILEKIEKCKETEDVISLENYMK
ncbi:MAG: hypothetical protein ACXQTP_01845 [Candidatus Methanofastidiosia archaeon]